MQYDFIQTRKLYPLFRKLVRLIKKRQRPISHSVAVKGHKVDCIWFKSLDCGGTIALLTTHCSSSYSVARCSTHSTTNSIIRLPSLDSNSSMIHIASAIRLAPNKHNKQRRQYIPLPSLLVK